MNNIKSLLDKYWKAETSLEEEELLRSYFQHGEVASEHESFRPLFTLFTEEKNNKYNKAISFGTEAQIRPIVNWRKRILSVAAVFLVLISASWFFKTSQDASKNNFEYASVEDPDEAMAVTMDALALLGSKLNNSSNHIYQNILHTEKMDIIKPNQ
jgi:hypothetical protein